jgi:hypothetical protein
MQGDTETVNIRSCPFCRKPIINTGRYKDLVNRTYKMEINPIKEKVYGTDEQIKIKRNELHETFTNFSKLNESIIKGNEYLNRACFALHY